MSKREDAGYIKKLSKANKDVLSWVHVPLVIMDAESEIAKKAQDLAEAGMADMMNTQKAKAVNTQAHTVMRVKALGVN